MKVYEHFSVKHKSNKRSKPYSEKKKKLGGKKEQRFLGGKPIWGNLEKCFNSFLIKNELLHPNGHGV